MKTFRKIFGLLLMATTIMLCLLPASAEAAEKKEQINRENMVIFIKSPGKYADPSEYYYGFGKLEVKNYSSTPKYSTSDKKVATVDENGRVTAVSVGECKITAKTKKATFTCNVTVRMAYDAKSIKKNIIIKTNKLDNNFVELKVTNKYKHPINVRINLKSKLDNGKSSYRSESFYIGASTTDYHYIYLDKSFEIDDYSCSYSRYMPTFDTVFVKADHKNKTHNSYSAFYDLLDVDKNNYCYEIEKVYAADTDEDGQAYKIKGSLINNAGIYKSYGHKIIVTNYILLYKNEKLVDVIRFNGIDRDEMEDDRFDCFNHKSVRNTNVFGDDSEYAPVDFDGFCSVNNSIIFGYESM
ncbi:MAG: Ig-like domain-containing protein [Lachnospiraceae bacterium]|nr:Ig-like domain-containing protein [Lachnospiraceae bacterium]